MRRARVLVLVAVSCMLVAVATADAKQPPRATLDNTAQLRAAAPGERVPIRWTMSTPARLPIPVAAEAVHLGGLAVYALVGGGPGRPAVRVPARPADPAARGLPAGRYIARVTVPTGGIRSITIEVAPTGSAAAAAIPASPIAIDNPFVAAGLAHGVDADPPFVLIAGLLAAFGALIALVAVGTTRRPLT